MTSVSERVRERIENDPFCAALGIELVGIEPGFAETRLELIDEHLNFHGTPHGGAIYALADAAFAAACNADGVTRVALETNVSYLAAPAPDATLLATAEETHATDRTGEYSVVVEDDGAKGGRRRIATFRGRAYRP